jgi:transposase
MGNGAQPCLARGSVRRINPNKLRQFARARGILAKNDRLDARPIAEYVAIMADTSCAAMPGVGAVLAFTRSSPCCQNSGR